MSIRSNNYNVQLTIPLNKLITLEGCIGHQEIKSRSNVNPCTGPAVLCPPHTSQLQAWKAGVFTTLFKKSQAKSPLIENVLNLAENIWKDRWKLFALRFHELTVSPLSFTIWLNLYNISYNFLSDKFCAKNRFTALS